MNIIEEIKKLNLPIDQYVVFGGASLAVRGIRETEDIDMVVSRELLDQCRQKTEWHIHLRLDTSREPGLSNGVVEMYPDVGGVEISFAELLSRREIVDGVSVASLEDVVRVKKAYDREKDRKDIELIEQYVNR